MAGRGEGAGCQSLIDYIGPTAAPALIGACRIAADKPDN